MGRLRRFEEYRFLGARDTMIVYDCDADDQFTELDQRNTDDDLVMRNLVSAFGPDSLPEAINRGFRPR